MEQNIYELLSRDPINTLKKLSEKNIVKILEECDKAFFNTDETLLTDDIYDIVKSYLVKLNPNNPYLKKIGADISFNKEKLPYYMGSLDKIKDNTKEVDKWKGKYQGNYIISEKLDGISCLLIYSKGETKMLTRGNGEYGQNITHILPYINLNVSSINQEIAIRGELIISRKNWEKISHMGANARNVVAGAIHSKKLNMEILKHIDFIAYDVLNPRKKLSESFAILKNKIPVVKNIQTTELNIDLLSTTLQKWRKDSNYEIDGIVIYHDEVHKIISGKNPKYAFAFKTIITQESAEVIVTDVEWNISKHRYLKPLVKFNEIVLSGVKIKQATGFNASYIKTNNIGPGSRIVIVRSGDVIPHIVQVLKPSSSGKPKMPEIPFIWNETNIDIILANDEKNREQDIQVFTSFMKTLEIEGVKEGVICKLYDAGFDELKKIINISIEDLLKIDGFQQKSAEKIIQSLKMIHKTDCNKLMSASNAFGRGFGEKKLKLITDKYPFIINNKKKGLELTINDIIAIKGVAEITAKQFIKNLPKFYEFIEELKIKCDMSENKEEKLINNKLDIFKDKKIVFSGFRNKDYEAILISSGAKIITTISKTTDYLIVKDNDETSSKINKAREQGTIIISKNELEKLL